MCCSLTLSFDSYDDLVEFTSKFKAFQEKQFKRKEKKFIETYSDLSKLENDDKNDKRGQHQIIYHNLAKQHQIQHPELSYREALRFVYKNNKVVEKTI